MQGDEGDRAIERTAREAAEKLFDRFAPQYPAALEGKLFDNMTEEERVEHILWEVSRDNVADRRLRRKCRGHGGR